MSVRYSYLSHLECSECRNPYSAEELHTVSPCCGRPLLATYDLAALGHDMAPPALAARAANMWRYHELLPVSDERFVLTLGEGMTPLLAASRLAPAGLEQRARLLVKDEGQNPTGSFKARGMAAAVSRALELGASGVGGIRGARWSASLCVCAERRARIVYTASEYLWR